METCTVSEPSPSHLPRATREAGAGAGAEAALAERSKQDKYAALNQCHNFTPVTIEAEGPFEPETFSSLRELDCRLKRVIGEAKLFSNLQQCLFVTVQQVNATAVMGKMWDTTSPFDFLSDSLSFFGWDTECLSFN